jgi:hypothetical protein
VVRVWCTKHRKYKGRRFPTSGCQTCLYIYWLRTERLDDELENLGVFD